MMLREEWDKTNSIFKTKGHNTNEGIIYPDRSETYKKIK